MKKLILCVGVLGLSVSAFAQKNEVVEAKKALDLFQAMYGKQDNAKTLVLLEKGLVSTDKAVVHEKTKGAADAWAYRAALASTISLLDTANEANMVAKQKVAEEALVIAKDLDKKGDLKDYIANATDNIANTIQTRAIKAYNRKDFATAYKIFTEISEKDPSNKDMYLNAGVAAKQAGNFEGAVKNFKKLVSFDVPDSKNLLLEVVNIQLNNLKDTVGGMATIDEALVKFPDDIDFVGTQTDIYIIKEEIEKSQTSLNKLIAKDPSKAVYHFLLGETFYKQALNVQKERVKVSSKKVKEYDALTAKMTSLIDKALPHYKKSLELDSKALHTLEALKQIYAFKNDTKNWEAMKKAIDALPKQPAQQ